LGAVTQFVQSERGGKKIMSFTTLIANFAVDHNCLLAELDGYSRLAQVGVGTAKIAEGVVFASLVADFAVDH
jgi:hypothetical protein